MKDKRQRSVAFWPYEAVYADPNYAASLLQAAANSLTMAYCGPNPMMPQLPIMASTPIAPAHPYAYPEYRYSPYQIPSRNPSNISSHSLSPMSTSLDGTDFTKLFKPYELL